MVPSGNNAIVHLRTGGAAVGPSAAAHLRTPQPLLPLSGAIRTPGACLLGMQRGGLSLDRLSKRVGRRLKTVTHLGQFAGRQIDPPLLDVRALVLSLGAPFLSVEALLQRLHLGRHLSHRLSKFGELPGDGRYVIGSCDFCHILRPEYRRAKRAKAVDDCPALGGRGCVLQGACGPPDPG